MKALFDADVLLDIALDRAPFADDSSEALEECRKAPHSLVIAWHTVSNVYYVLRAAQGDRRARAFISEIIRFATVASGGAQAIERALALPMSDFEDALQVAAAAAAGAERIITRNVRDYRGSPVLTKTPQDLLAELRKQ